MNQWKRLSFYLLLNVLVSIFVTWIVLTVWDRMHPKEQQPGRPASVIQPNPDTNLALSPSLAITPLPIVSQEAVHSPTGTVSSQTVEEYQVQVNDTLGVIAEKYGISVEELMRFNGLTDPNALSVGMLIYIPVTPEVIPTETPSSTRATLQITGSLSLGTQEAHVVINSVIGAGDLASERVFLSRTGSGVLLLAGWKLKDENGNVFNFPYLELYQGGAVNVWTTSGSQTVVDLYWGLQYPVWKSGETATLVDAQGKVQATYKVP
jgi:LysM repeat protein